MRSAVTILTFLGLVPALGCGSQPGPPQQQIDVVGIRSELLAIGQAEGHYLVAHSTYATIEQLQQDGSPGLGTDNRGYVFRAATSGAVRAGHSARQRIRQPHL